MLTPALSGKALLAIGLISAWLLQKAFIGFFNLFFHPLATFPGPRVAAFTSWYKTYQEVFLGKSWIDVLQELHKQYGKIVRVGPNELHFSDPEAYHEIYNNSNRWDKEAKLYQSFGEDRSSFGFLTYAESKQRKDIMTPLFSRRAIFELQSLVQSNLDRLCEVLTANNSAGKSSDLFFGLRCFTMDTITTFCFAKSVNALAEPDFKAPIIEAMEASLPAFVLFKHFSLIRKTVFGMPPWLSVITSPQTAGLIHLQQLLGAQVNEVVKNPEVLQDSPHRIIYHELLSPKASKGAPLPSAGSLYEEAQALMFGGGDTVGNTLMLGTFHLLGSPLLVQRLKKELKAAWPILEDPPKLEELEKLPFLTAVIKESLRISPGVASPLLRVVPATGATISGSTIPADASMSGSFVHNSPEVFKNHKKFDPDRWLQPDSASLERWLVAFSKGPRMCMGQNLANCEMYLGFASLFRRFDLKLDGTSVDDLTWRECFLPYFQGRHLQAFCKPVEKLTLLELSYDFEKESQIPQIELLGDTDKTYMAPLVMPFTISFSSSAINPKLQIRPLSHVIHSQLGLPRPSTISEQAAGSALGRTQVGAGGGVVVVAAAEATVEVVAVEVAGKSYLNAPFVSAPPPFLAKAVGEDWGGATGEAEISNSKNTTQFRLVTADFGTQSVN
ncbi:hypothetical protein G7Y89_g11222 [Cudoniella acicularis]|uniref:Cytochrome P450 n=1 Tax=Cudoniella acicularis TaxID=354080 RepID=A0A8H4RE19_9HELO|nr:hypothetical protein G7Y89_g11222 [Cudoniella acicularis]